MAESICISNNSHLSSSAKQISPLLFLQFNFSLFTVIKMLSYRQPSEKFSIDGIDVWYLPVMAFLYNINRILDIGLILLVIF